MNFLSQCDYYCSSKDRILYYTFVLFYILFLVATTSGTTQTQCRDRPKVNSWCIPCQWNCILYKAVSCINRGWGPSNALPTSSLYCKLLKNGLKSVSISLEPTHVMVEILWVFSTICRFSPNIIKLEDTALSIWPFLAAIYFTCM